MRAAGSRPILWVILTPGMDRLEERIGYRFRNRELLARALTHASSRDRHNERLEFLGDAVLNLVVAEALFRTLPDLREGRLTELKALLVARDTLERTAARLGMDEFLRTGGSLAGRATVPRSVLGNALEAVLGAAYLDVEPAQRLETVRRLALGWLQPEMGRLVAVQERARAKSRLQDWAQRTHGCLPEYRVVETFEHPETRSFLVAAVVAGRSFPAAWAAAKKEAERLAAWEALLTLRGEEEP